MNIWLETPDDFSSDCTTAAKKLGSALFKWVQRKFSPSDVFLHCLYQENGSLLLVVRTRAYQTEVVVSVDMDIASLELAVSEPVAADLLAAFQGLLTNAAKQVCVEHFAKNYTMTRRFSFEGKRILLKSTMSGCRFCKRDRPEVKFNKEAHALPDGLGNDRIFTEYECDDCNQKFGSTIENHFANFSNIERALFLVSGKNGIVKFKQKNRTGVAWDELSKRIELRPSHDGHLTFRRGHIEFFYRRPSYIPVFVLKAFYKMALTLMRDSDLQDHEHLIDWLMKPGSEGKVEAHYPVFYAFLPHRKCNRGRCILARRNSSDEGIPTFLFFILYGNCSYQIILPSKSEIENNRDLKNIPMFPLLGVAGSDEDFLDLSSSQWKRGDPIRFNLVPTGRMRRRKVKLRKAYWTD